MDLNSIHESLMGLRLTSMYSSRKSPRSRIFSATLRGYASKSNWLPSETGIAVRTKSALEDRMMLPRSISRAVVLVNSATWARTYLLIRTFMKLGGS